MSSIPKIRFKGFTDDWEQRKLGEIITEYKETVDSDCTLPILTSSKTEGVILQEEHFGRKQQHDITGYNILPRNYCTYRNRSDGVDFTFNINKCCDKGIISKFYPVFSGKNSDVYFLSLVLNNSEEVVREIAYTCTGTGQKVLSFLDLQKMKVRVPNFDEQKEIAAYFESLDHIITLHRRAYHHKKKEDLQMNTTTTNNATTLFCDYYKQWITVYKEGAIRPVTMSKYNMAHQWLERLTPELTIGNLDRFAYQKLLNDYATSHERQTTMDFHHHLKCAILDAVDEGLIQRDPTRKAIIKGKTPREKKPKYLNQYELHKLLDNLDLKSEVNMDWLILLIAKTGMRFSEALALTPKDFDLSRQMLSVSKTWDYKNHSGFLPTKNKSSIRKIPLDWQTVMQFAELVKQLPEDEPIFVKGKIYNSTVNNILARHCKEVEIPIISIHGLRHTHASLLLFAGVSIASVARRLGHSNMTTTQKTYLHIIQELESKDIDLIMRSLSNLN